MQSPCPGDPGSMIGCHGWHGRRRELPTLAFQPLNRGYTMNHGSMKNHLTWMLVAAGAVLAVLLLLQVDLGRALSLAAAAACPLGMLGMMFMMGRGMGGHGDHDRDQRGNGQENQECHAGHADHQDALAAVPDETRR